MNCTELIRPQQAHFYIYIHAFLRKAVLGGSPMTDERASEAPLKNVIPAEPGFTIEGID